MEELEQSLQQEIEAPKEPAVDVKDPFAGIGLTATGWVKFDESEEIKPEPVKESPVSLIATIDGVVYPALYKINNEYCYTESDKNRLLKRLDDNGVKYEIETLAPIDGLRVTEGVKYNSIDEALNHIKGATPETLVIPYLKEQLQITEQWLGAALTKLNAVETVSVTLAEKVEALEVKTADTVAEPIKTTELTK